MNKITASLILLGLTSGGALSAAEQQTSQTGLNGVTIELSGSFYQPNETQMLQSKTPVFEFDGLTRKGGRQIAHQYQKAFDEDVMGNTIAVKLESLNKGLSKEEIAQILTTMVPIKNEFPQLLEFYAGLGEATQHSPEQVYLAAWASDGLFAKGIQEMASYGLAELSKATANMRGCTAIGWNNGVIGQNQDMPVAFGGHGAIWKSGTLIVHAAEPLFTSMAMGREMATVLNTVDAFHVGALEQGVPVSGLSMVMVEAFDDANKAREMLDKIEVNAAYSTHFADKKGHVLTVENRLGDNVVIDGSRKGYITHSNHPLGQEQALVDRYANGNWQIFDYALKTTLWRNQAAEAHAKYSPSQDVVALKAVFSQKPLMKAPYEGNGFVTTNSVIHDLNEGCSYGTTWLPTMQDYTKVCFD